MRGREAAQLTLAKAADQLVGFKSTEEILTKEQSPQVICLAGGGMGKSAFLAHGLETHRKYCQNPELQKLLHKDAKPLNVLLSFNGSTTYDYIEGTNANVLLNRRMLSRALGITWEEALEFKLSDQLTVAMCMEGIVRYHREINGMQPTQKVFVYLGVDDMSRVSPPREHDLLRNIAEALRTLRDLQDIFVATLMAGSHAHAMHTALRNSGISAVSIDLIPLNNSHYDEILVEDVGLCEQYRADPQMQKLIVSTFPVLRPLGEAIAQLPVEYDASAVRAAVIAVNTYFMFKRRTLKQVEMERVIAAVISGEVIPFEDTALPLVDGSVLSWDSLQNDETVQLIPTSTADGEENDHRQVSVPILLLQRWMKSFPGEVSSMAAELIRLAERSDANSFKLFTARFIATKLALMHKSGKREFTMEDVFLSALTTKDLKTQRFQSVSDEILPSCDMIRDLTHESSCLPEKERTTTTINMQHLWKGGFIVNAAGALIDVISLLKTRKEYDEAWKPAVLVILSKQTDGKTGLSKQLVDADLSRALKAVAALPSIHNTDFNSECSKQMKTQLIKDLTVVNFSNRELTIKAKNGKKTMLTHKEMGQLFLKDHSRSVIVDKQSFPRIIGPVLFNLISKRTFSTLQFQTKRYTGTGSLMMFGVRRLLK